MQEVLAKATEQATQHGAARILAVRLRIGGLSGVVPDALRSAFEVLSGATMAAGAALECELVEPVAWCPACQFEFAVNDLVYVCPRCETFCPELRRGRELEITSLEIE